MSNIPFDLERIPLEIRCESGEESTEEQVHKIKKALKSCYDRINENGRELLYGYTRKIIIEIAEGPLDVLEKKKGGISIFTVPIDFNEHSYTSISIKFKVNLKEIKNKKVEIALISRFGSALAHYEMLINSGSQNAARKDEVIEKNTINKDKMIITSLRSASSECESILAVKEYVGFGALVLLAGDSKSNTKLVGYLLKKGIPNHVIAIDLIVSTWLPFAVLDSRDGRGTFKTMIINIIGNRLDKNTLEKMFEQGKKAAKLLKNKRYLSLKEIITTFELENDISEKTRKMIMEN